MTRIFMHVSVRTPALLAVSAALLSADVTYQQTTKFKGGALIEMVQKMASMPLMGRMMGGTNKAFQDQTYDVYIKGNKWPALARFLRPSTTWMQAL